MSVLSFEKPKKVRSTSEHNDTFASDSGVAGTYVPNMSHADCEKWKAKLIGGDNPRVEIRKTLNGVQVLMIVWPDFSTRITANGPMTFSSKDWLDLQSARNEALSSGQLVLGDKWQTSS